MSDTKRLVRIRTDGSTHRALLRLSLADQPASAIQIRGQLYADMKDLQRLLEYGLISRDIVDGRPVRVRNRAEYTMTRDGYRVLAELEMIQGASTARRIPHEGHTPWEATEDMTFEWKYDKEGNEVPRRPYYVPLILVPGSAKWQEYFKRRNW